MTRDNRFGFVFLLGVLMGLALSSTPARAGDAIQINGDPTAGYSLRINTCEAAGADGGSNFAGSLKWGVYLMSVTSEDVTLCSHTYLSSVPTACGAAGYTDGGTDGGSCWSCPSGGYKYPQGTLMKWKTPSTGSGYSCRSDGGTGGVSFQLINNP